MKDLNIYDYFYSNEYARMIQIIILNILVLPIFLMEDLSSLKFMSLIGLITVTYTIFVRC